MDVRLAESDRWALHSGGRPLAPKLIGDLLRLVDIGIVLAFGLAIYIGYIYPVEPGTLPRYLGALVAAALVAAILFNDFGVYAGDFLFTRMVRTERMVSAWAVSFAVLLVIAFALKVSDQYSRVWALSWFAASGAAMALCRVALGRWIFRLGQRGRFANRTAIVGTGEQALRLAAHLQAHDAVRTRLVGFVAPDEAAGAPGSDDIATLGRIDALIDMIRRGAVDQVFIALPWSEPERLRETLHRLSTTSVTIRLAPDLAGFDFLGQDFGAVAGLPVLDLFDRPISEWSYVLKTLEDRVLAGALLVFLSPLLAVIWVAVKVDSPGPALFKQKRYGFNGNLFEVWKFRTMRAEMVDADAARLTTKGDPRVTRVGRLLRATSLDELPQLVNVLAGDMSLVGPRPHAVAAKAGGKPYNKAVERYAARHRVKPGITGWAQVNGWRGETDTVEKLERRVEHDLYYIDNWSIWLDLWIIARTVALLFRDKNAY